MSHEAWTACCERLRASLPAQQFNTWIRALSAEPEEGGEGVRLRVLAPNRFILQWVRER